MTSKQLSACSHVALLFAKCVACVRAPLGAWVASSLNQACGVTGLPLRISLSPLLLPSYKCAVMMGRH